MSNIEATSNQARIFSLNTEISPAIVLGSGYDNKTKTVKNVCATSNKIPIKAMNTAPTYFMDWCENYSELTSFFGLSASASFGGTSASFSATVNMMRSTNIENSKIYIAVSARMIARVEFFESASLTKDALNSLNTENLINFAEKYGGVFAKSIFYGGELAIVLEISASQTETIEQLRASMHGEGWGAKAQGELEQSLRGLTRNRSVVVRYCQSGGSIGSTTSGIVVTDTDGVIVRMTQFVKEVWGSNGLDGSVVPLQAEFDKIRSLKNWPPQQTGDPDNQFPDEIERIAKSILTLKDKLIVIEEALRPTRLVGPNTLETARALFLFIKDAINQAESEVGKMMRGAKTTFEFSVESFWRYRIRRLLDVDPGAHPNAKNMFSLNNSDSQQFIDRVFGQKLPDFLNPWPKLSIQEWWGYQGQEPGGPGVHVICGQHGGNIMAKAQELAGNPGPDQGVLVHASLHSGWGYGGGTCGYHPAHFVVVRTEKPDLPTLPPLPFLPTDVINKTEITCTKVSLTQNGPSTFNAEFRVDLPLANTCGRYTVLIYECLSADSNVIRKRLDTSFWIDKKHTSLKLEHIFNAEEAWHPLDFEVDVEISLHVGEVELNGLIREQHFH